MMVTFGRELCSKRPSTPRSPASVSRLLLNQTLNIGIIQPNGNAGTAQVSMSEARDHKDPRETESASRCGRFEFDSWLRSKVDKDGLCGQRAT